MTSEAGFASSMNVCVDIDSFFGAGACFGLAAKALEEPLPTRVLRRMEDEVQMSRAWKYLSLSTMRQAIQHQARRLKGGGSGGAGGKPLPGWGIALIVVGAVIFVALAAVFIF